MSEFEDHARHVQELEIENRGLKQENDTYRTNLEAMVDARTQQWKTALSNLERSYDITLEALGDALDLKDAETEGHSRRVTAFSHRHRATDGPAKGLHPHPRARCIPARHR
jgi:hypothetical protein